MLALKNLKQAEEFVAEQQAVGNDVRWDGWDMIFFRTAPQAVYSKQGVIRNGVFGFDNRVTPDQNGQWVVDYRNVRMNNNRQ